MVWRSTLVALALSLSLAACRSASSTSDSPVLVDETYGLQDEKQGEHPAGPVVDDHCRIDVHPIEPPPANYNNVLVLWEARGDLMRLHVLNLGDRIKHVSASNVADASFARLPNDKRAQIELLAASGKFMFSGRDLDLVPGGVIPKELTAASAGAQSKVSVTPFAKGVPAKIVVQHKGLTTTLWIHDRGIMFE